MSLMDRVKNIILTPKTEWPVIDREPGDVAYVFTNYVAILAAIPAICGFIGLSIVGIGSFRVPAVAGLLSAIVGYLLTFVIVYVVALIVDALAPTFGGSKNFESALKVTAYSFTPVWVVGIFLLLPALGLLTLLLLVLAMIYGVYLSWMGLPVLMKAPQDGIIPYVAAAATSAIIIYFVFSRIVGAIFASPRMM